jgi:hypothetical protein
MSAKRKTIGKYIQVSVTSITQAGAKKKARQLLNKKGEKGWKLVGAVPSYRHHEAMNPDKKEYVWAVSYRKRVSA